MDYIFSPPTFHEKWWGILVSSLYGAPSFVFKATEGSHGITILRNAEFRLHRYPKKFQPRLRGEAAIIFTAACSAIELLRNNRLNYQRTADLLYLNLYIFSIYEFYYLSAHNLVFPFVNNRPFLA